MDGSRPPQWDKFLADEKHLDEITNDHLILRRIKKRALRTFSRPLFHFTPVNRIARKLNIPQVAIFGSHDKINGPEKSRAVASKWIPPERLFTLQGPHAIWYACPREVADILTTRKIRSID